jgi:adenine-specific DNA methylase
MRQLRTYYSSLGAPSEPLPAIRVGSATNLQSIPDASIDYVFTDPPFGSNLFYADCNLVWESWLGGLTRESDEAVVNRSRDARRGGKSVDDYELLMTESLREVHRVLKPKAWATLVFHNTDPAVWRAIQNAAESAGFKIDDAGALDRKQQSHKGYKGRSESEDVAHFDVIMSMRKRLISRTRKSTAHDALSVQDLVKSVWSALPPDARTIQRVHSEVIQALARAGRKLDEVSFEDVRVHVPDAPTKRSAPSTAPRKRKS